jgi:2'-5' RNA ligase
MRLFVGVIPSPEALSHAAGAVNRIASTAPDVRWVPPERWHLTCVFLGEVDPENVPRCAAALDVVGAAYEEVQGLRLAGAGIFPGVLWLGLVVGQRAAYEHEPSLPLGVGGRDPFSALGQVTRAVRRAMRAERIPIERRPWRPHLTIGRWKRGRPTSAAHPSEPGTPAGESQALGAARDLAEYAGPTFGVSELVLIHSITGPPRYEPLHVTRLSPTPIP